MTECWDGDAELRPHMDEVVKRVHRLWKTTARAVGDAPAAPRRAHLPTFETEMVQLAEAYSWHAATTRVWTTTC